MSNTLITEGGQGSIDITDTALHDFSSTPIGQIVVLEDSTGFSTVNMETRDDNTLAWGVSDQIAGTGTAPGFSTGHPKGEYITGVYNKQRFVAVQLSGGRVRCYFS